MHDHAIRSTGKPSWTLPPGDRMSRAGPHAGLREESGRRAAYGTRSTPWITGHLRFTAESNDTNDTKDLTT